MHLSWITSIPKQVIDGLLNTSKETTYRETNLEQKTLSVVTLEMVVFTQYLTQYTSPHTYTLPHPYTLDNIKVFIVHE